MNADEETVEMCRGYATALVEHDAAVKARDRAQENISKFNGIMTACAAGISRRILYTGKPMVLEHPFQPEMCMVFTCIKKADNSANLFVEVYSYHKAKS